MVDDRPVIVLVGMMGSGKSTVGRLLAGRLGVAFCDTDDRIKHESQLLIGQLFDELGEDAFRQRESAALVECLATAGVVATGGGAVLRAENRSLISGRNRWVAWLDAQPEELAERLKDAVDRPLLGENALASLVRLDGERRPLYAQVASARVETNRRTPAEVCEEIVSLIGSLS